jgi:hypothetical protein
MRHAVHLGIAGGWWQLVRDWMQSKSNEIDSETLIAAMMLSLVDWKKIHAKYPSFPHGAVIATEAINALRKMEPMKWPERKNLLEEAANIQGVRRRHELEMESEDHEELPRTVVIIVHVVFEGLAISWHQHLLGETAQARTSLEVIQKMEEKPQDWNDAAYFLGRVLMFLDIEKAEGETKETLRSLGEVLEAMAH